MSSAMLSGVGGLKAHQTMIDVAGNNLANVNTTSFKSSSVTFEELLSETLKDASAPTENLGGINPMQIGNGVKVGSINRNMSQGSLQYTGRSLDMAIEGSGYFVLNDGSGDVYTRVGQFAVDSQYKLVDPTTGYRVQRVGNEGVTEGFQDPTSNDIRIPYDVALPANATEEVKFAGNLSGNKTEPSRNLLTSDTKYTDPGGTVASRTSQMSLLQQAQNLTRGDTITITGTNKTGQAVNFTYTYNNTSDATGEISTFNGANVPNPGTLVGTDTFMTNTNALASELRINFGEEVVQLYFAGSQSMTADDFISAYNNSATESTASIVGGNMVLSNDNNGLTQTVWAITNTGGNIEWGAGTGNAVATGDAAHTNGTAEVGGDTLGDFLDAITNAFGGSQVTQATMINGEIRMEDYDAGYSQSYIDSMTFNDADASGSSFSLPSQFDILTAGGQIEKTINVEIFDPQGNSYTLAGSFVRRDDFANTWDFVIKSVGGNVRIHDRKIEGITFQTDGSYGELKSVIPDGMGGLTIDPNSVNFSLEFLDSDPGNVRSVRLNMGTLGELDGLTQFGGPSTAASNGQDGYAAGWLSTMSVSREGTLVGVFSNGIRRDIAALKIATFQNAAGLKSIGGNYFQPTANSGDPVANKASEGSAGVIHGGAIEKSNVEVAEEFVKLIEAQNGYQANARTIKVANEMLRELTQLIR